MQSVELSMGYRWKVSGLFSLTTMFSDRSFGFQECAVCVSLSATGMSRSMSSSAGCSKSGVKICVSWLIPLLAAWKIPQLCTVVTNSIGIIEVYTMLTFPVLIKYANDTFCFTNVKVRSPVLKFLLVNGYFPKVWVIYESNIYITDRDRFWIRPCFNLTFVKFVYWINVVNYKKYSINSIEN